VVAAPVRIAMVFGTNQNTVFHAALTLSALCFILTGSSSIGNPRGRDADLAGGAIHRLFFLNYRLACHSLGGLETASPDDGDGNGDVDISPVGDSHDGAGVQLGACWD